MAEPWCRTIRPTFTPSNETGRAEANLWIPATLPHGRHTLGVRGFGDDGEPRTVSRHVQVLPDHANVALILFLRGLMLNAAGLYGLRVSRKRKNQLAEGK